MIDYKKLITIMMITLILALIRIEKKKQKRKIKKVAKKMTKYLSFSIKVQPIPFQYFTSRIDFKYNCLLTVNVC
jgi:hypothetical protein